MLKKVRAKLGQLEELKALRRENEELQESVNDLVELNISITQERTKLRETLQNLKQEKLALIEQVKMMHAKLAPRIAVKKRFSELNAADYWD